MPVYTWVERGVMRANKPKKERKKEYVVTENIHNPPSPTEGIGISWGIGVWVFF